MRSIRRSSLCPLLCLALAALSPVAAAAEEAAADFVDRVGTLKLDRVLDARGSLGGVTIDRLGFLYVANFRDAVWRISPDGEVTALTRGLYGASGNAIDARGDLYQGNFLANTITRIARTGEVSRFVGEGLNGPVGMAFDAEGTLYVCNCNGNSISRVTPGGVVEPFAGGDMFACPNGIALGADKNFYVTNFNNLDILRISPAGVVERFVTVPTGAGNAHITTAKGIFYVTKILSNRVIKIDGQGEITPLAGTGEDGHDDGPALEATLFRPNGIAVSPLGDRLYVNTVVGEYNQPKASRLTVRTIDLVTLTGVLDEAMTTGGLDAAAAAYARYRADPVRGRENTAGEMITYGYRFLTDAQDPRGAALLRPQRRELARQPGGPVPPRRGLSLHRPGRAGGGPVSQGARARPRARQRGLPAGAARGRVVTPTESGWRRLEGTAATSPPRPGGEPASRGVA